MQEREICKICAHGGIENVYTLIALCVIPFRCPPQKYVMRVGRDWKCLSIDIIYRYPIFNPPIKSAISVGWDWKCCNVGIILPYPIFNTTHFVRVQVRLYNPNDGGHRTRPVFKIHYAGGLNGRKLNQEKGNLPIQSRPTDDLNNQSFVDKNKNCPYRLLYGQ